MTDSEDLVNMESQQVYTPSEGISPELTKERLAHTPTLTGMYEPSQEHYEHDSVLQLCGTQHVKTTVEGESGAREEGADIEEGENDLSRILAEDWMTV